jgi:hypothetical protein
MMKCRLCSQRLTRPGKLCRECEHERARAEEGATPIEGLESVIAADARVAEARHGGRIRARNVVLLAFCTGALGAGILRLVLHDGRGEARSVMLDAALQAPASVAPNADRRRGVTPR